MAPAPEHPTPLGALGLVLLRFYEWRDSLRSPLTPLDREVLASTYGRRGTKAQLADMVHAHVGVTYDPTVLWVHECLLLVGAPSRVVPEPLNAGQHRQAEPDPAEPTGDRATGGSYILLIEAEREVREEIGGALREAGYRVVPARNGARALLSALQEPPTLALIDMRPPYNDARVFAQKLAAHGLNVRTFVMANAREGERAANVVDASAWIERYFSMDQLVAAVRQAASPG